MLGNNWLHHSHVHAGDKAVDGLVGMTLRGRLTAINIIMRSSIALEPRLRHHWCSSM